MSMIDLYSASKDFIIPLASPTIAILTLITYAKQERRKMLVQSDLDIKRSVHAAERDLLLLRESYQLFSLKLKTNEPIEPERIELIKETAERLFGHFTKSPVMYEAFFSKNKINIRMDRMPLLLSEVQLWFRRLHLAQEPSPLVLFGLYLLIFARVDSGQDAEEIKILELLVSKNQELFSAWYHFDS